MIRERVIEHRITTYHGGTRVRYWIEADPAFGGVHRTEANRAVETAEKKVSNWKDLRPLVRFLMEQVRAASSVEACDRHGDGYAIHRDWP